MNSSDKFRALVANRFKFRLFMLKNLPAAYFSGLQVKEITEDKAVVSIPFKFLTKNPFRSMYFASQAMAAELATGVLALAQVFGRKPGVSMLVLGMRATFHKKVIGKVQFTCTDGQLIKQAVEKTIATGEGVTVEAKSVGTDKDGIVVAEFYFTWTFKAKSI